MDAPGASPPTTRIFHVAALALLGLLLSLLPAAERLDASLLDLQWRLLRSFDPRPAPDDIVIVGIDEATVQSVRQPREMWHQPLGLALARIASAKPRAIGLDVVLPDRSFDEVQPGLDRALMTGLAAARQGAPFVATLAIDPRTRSARPIHAPLLAVLDEPRLGLGMLSREIDGVTRRFSLLVPTMDGGFPTLVGRLCRALERDCDEGYIDYALGAPFRLIPMHRVLESAQAPALASVFHDRIVLIGEARSFTDRVRVPVNLAGWESPRGDSPSIVVQAQALRTALLQAAPRRASQPLVMVLTALAALLVLLRDWRLAAATGLLAAGAFLVAALLALRAGLVLPVAAALATVLASWIVVGLGAFRRTYELRRR